MCASRCSGRSGSRLTARRRDAVVDTAERRFGSWGGLVAGTADEIAPVLAADVARDRRVRAAVHRLRAARDDRAVHGRGRHPDPRERRRLTRVSGACGRRRARGRSSRSTAAPGPRGTSARRTARPAAEDRRGASPISSITSLWLRRMIAVVASDSGQHEEEVPADERWRCPGRRARRRASSTTVKSTSRSGRRDVDHGEETAEREAQAADAGLRIASTRPTAARARRRPSDRNETFWVVNATASGSWKTRQPRSRKRHVSTTSSPRPATSR